MHTQLSLQQQAISAAKRQDWATAVALNSELLSNTPDDLGALNRLGVAQLQLGQIKEAKISFQTVIDKDKSNLIAKKHLARLRTNQSVSVPLFSPIQFIEESGKSKIVELHRLAGRQVLDAVAVGQLCELKPKSRYISVEHEGVYLGALPEDLSFRLSKLIAKGNTYECYLYSVTAKSCMVFIKETLRSRENQDSHSFPLVRSMIAPINDIDEEFLVDEGGVEFAVETESDELPTDQEESKTSYTDFEDSRE